MLVVHEWVVVRDEWLPERYFDESNGGSMAASDYAAYCNRMYEGSFTVRPCSADHAARFERATVGRFGNTVT